MHKLLGLLCLAAAANVYAEGDIYHSQTCSVPAGEAHSACIVNRTGHYLQGSFRLYQYDFFKDGGSQIAVSDIGYMEKNNNIVLSHSGAWFEKQGLESIGYVLTLDNETLPNCIVQFAHKSLTTQTISLVENTEGKLLCV